MSRINGRNRRQMSTALRGTAALLGGMVVVSAAASAADATPGSPETIESPETPVSPSIGPVSATLDQLQRQAVDLRQQVLETQAAYQQAQARAAEVSAASVSATAAADRAMRYADNLHSKVAGRPAIPGLGYVLGVLGHGDPELDEAVAAAKAQEVAMKAADEARIASEAADKKAAEAKTAWTEARSLAARIEVRIRAMEQAEKSLQKAEFPASYDVSNRQQDLRNKAALANWRAYLIALADEQIVPPAASALVDPLRLPAPLEPVLDKAGKPIPGVAQVWRIGADPLVVLPAETIRAVSHAFSHVGRPSPVNPDSYACGGFTRHVWATVGYQLPRGSVEQWETLAQVDRAQLQVGDLVYLGNRYYGIHRSGVNLGGGLWIALKPATGETVVEPLPSAAVYGVRRVTLPKPAQPTPAPVPLPGFPKIGCGEVKMPKTPEGGITGIDSTMIQHASTVVTEGTSWSIPLAEGSYTLSAEFGASGGLWSGARHTGQDFAAPIGTPVRAALAGVVSVEHPAWAGNLVRIDHGNGLETLYAHLSAVSVAPGQHVAAGTVIGAVGTEGNSTGPHLHFEVRVDGTPVDPLPLLMPSTSAAKWGGYSNGMIPTDALCHLASGSGQSLRCDAAVAFRLLDAAYRAEFGRPIAITDSYRSLAEQQSLFAAKPNLAAVPGTSNHGWGLAVDLAGGIERFGTPEYQWMVANAPRFGWMHPDWARQGGGRPEPWHFEFGRIS
jgi:hypothetical protein